jgi:CRISPR-associated protein Cas5t
MSIVVVEAVAPVASWRPAEALTYHRTLPLPPYTTQVGLLGAALGLVLPDAYRFVADHGLSLGVGGWHDGKARDLWKHQKLKGDAQVSDVLLRELWIDSRLVFVIETPDSATAERVAFAFSQPAFPLTTGPSDALMQPLAVRIEEGMPTGRRRLIHTLVYEEISPYYQPFEKIKDMPLTRTVQAPSVENLPTGFVFDSTGNRQLAGRALVTFIADAIELDEKAKPVEGYCICPQTRFLQSRFSQWKELELEWTIPVHRYDLPQTPAAESSTTPSPSPAKRGRQRKVTGDM